MTALTSRFEASIFPPDWSQFIPDVLSGFIVSVPVGIGVGIALWQWQKRAEETRAKRVALSEWRIARSRVALTITHPVDRSVNADSLKKYVQLFDDALAEGVALTVGEWADAAPEDQELAAMAGLLIEGNTLKRWAEALEADMSVALMRNGMVLPAHTGRHLRWACACILGITDPGAYVNDPLDQLRIPAATMLEFNDIAGEIDSFSRKLVEVEGHYRSLRSSILHV